MESPDVTLPRGPDPELLQRKLEIAVNLPCDYPASVPDVYVRSIELSGQQHKSLRQGVISYIESIPRGEICIANVISWLQDNVAFYFTESKASVSPVKEEKQEVLARYWIYSHHIYNPTKRRNILNLAKEFDLTGFSLPGKPGIICLEGEERNVAETWSLIRHWNWKKLVCKRRETEKQENKSVNEMRVFPDFSELNFEVKHQKHHGRDYHMDMGGLLRFLNEYNFGYVFEEFFGIEGRTSDD